MTERLVIVMLHAIVAVTVVVSITVLAALGQVSGDTAVAVGLAAVGVNAGGQLGQQALNGGTVKKPPTPPAA